MKIKGSSMIMVCVYQTTLRYSPQDSSLPSSSIWSHHGTKHQCVEAMMMYSFNISCNGILSLLPVNKKNITLNY